MRLDDFDPNLDVEDQRGSGGGGGFGFGGGGGGGGGLLFGLLPLIGSRFGCGGIVVVLILLAVFGGLGNLGGLTGGGQSGAPTQQVGRAGTDTKSSCSLDAASTAACDAFSSADHTWAKLFQAQGQQFTAPKLVFYSGNGQSGCGAAQSAMGPFYCPTDRGIYLDTSFFAELQNRFHAGGDFAQDYVIAHEFGHHIQNLLGVSDRVAQAERGGGGSGAQGQSVRLELQADCYAGVWAAQNKDRLDPGDIQEGLTAAHAIGDDTLQQETQGRVMPDSFTHGTSAERMKWLKRGLDSGDPGQCDTFSGAI